MNVRGRTTIVLGLSMALASCASNAPRSRADIGAQAACRIQADEAYEIQNRDAVYQDDAFQTGLKDAPYSSGGTARNYTRGLADQYARDNAVQRCLQGIGQPGTDVQVAPVAPAQTSPTK